MKALDRRSLLTVILGAAAVATLGSGLDPKQVEAAPFPVGGGHPKTTDGLVEKAHVVIVGPRRRRRRWVCWRHRGRRVCGWRW